MDSAKGLGHPYAIAKIGMKPLQNKRVLLGVTGGIAAYKSADLTRRLREVGAEVRVVMTAAATEFITALTLQALSGHPVHRHLLDPEAEAGMGHIALARCADVVLVAPASANFMARLAHGHTDDLLATLCLASTAPLALAPAMNREMWLNAATQANRYLLEARGVLLWGPADGSQACGETGPGRMLEPTELVQRLAALFETGILSGLNVLVSAGPTREAIDPVRYIANRSSGKMGYAIASAAAEAGAKVTLVSGPVPLPAPARIERVDVESAEDMRRAVFARAPHNQILIACAAVADYRPAQRALQKLKKSTANYDLPLVRSPDILAEISALCGDSLFTVGFAAETESLTANAKAKRAAKKIDMIVANRVDQAGVGFESDENALQVFWEGGEKIMPRAHKAKLSRELIVLIAERYRAKNPA